MKTKKYLIIKEEKMRLKWILSNYVVVTSGLCRQKGLHQNIMQIHDRYWQTRQCIIEDVSQKNVNTFNLIHASCVSRKRWKSMMFWRHLSQNERKSIIFRSVDLQMIFMWHRPLNNIITQNFFCLLTKRYLWKYTNFKLRRNLWNLRTELWIALH